MISIAYFLKLVFAAGFPRWPGHWLRESGLKSVMAAAAGGFLDAVGCLLVGKALAPAS